MPETETAGMTIKQKADAEAARAESEETDDGTGGADPSEPDPEEAEAEEAATEPEAKAKGGRTDKQTQAMFDRAMHAFQGKLREVFEVDDLTPAPYPGVVGFMLPGYGEPKTHPSFQQCSTCNGLGKILTGANTGQDDKDWHDCPDGRCKGRGFWQKAGTTPQTPVTGPLAVQTVAVSNGEFEEAPAWMGDPNLSAGA